LEKVQGSDVFDGVEIHHHAELKAQALGDYEKPGLQICVPGNWWN
jgi:hypothetical protein